MSISSNLPTSPANTAIPQPLSIKAKKTELKALFSKILCHEIPKGLLCFSQFDYENNRGDLVSLKERDLIPLGKLGKIKTLKEFNELFPNLKDSKYDFYTNKDNSLFYRGIVPKIEGCYKKSIDDRFFKIFKGSKPIVLDIGTRSSREPHSKDTDDYGNPLPQEPLYYYQDVRVLRAIGRKLEEIEMLAEVKSLLSECLCREIPEGFVCYNNFNYGENKGDKIDHPSLKPIGSITEISSLDEFKELFPGLHECNYNFHSYNHDSLFYRGIVYNDRTNLTKCVDDRFFKIHKGTGIVLDIGTRSIKEPRSKDTDDHGVALPMDPPYYYNDVIKLKAIGRKLEELEAHRLKYPDMEFPTPPSSKFTPQNDSEAKLSSMDGKLEGIEKILKLPKPGTKTAPPSRQALPLFAETAFWGWSLEKSVKQQIESLDQRELSLPKEIEDIIKKTVPYIGYETHFAFKNITNVADLEGLFPGVGNGDLSFYNTEIFARDGCKSHPIFRNKQTNATVTHKGSHLLWSLVEKLQELEGIQAANKSLKEAKEQLKELTEIRVDSIVIGTALHHLETLAFNLEFGEAYKAFRVAKHSNELITNLKLLCVSLKTLPSIGQIISTNGQVLSTSLLLESVIPMLGAAAAFSSIWAIINAKPVSPALTQADFYNTINKLTPFLANMEKSILKSVKENAHIINNKIQTAQSVILRNLFESHKFLLEEMENNFSDVRERDHTSDFNTRHADAAKRIQKYNDQLWNAHLYINNEKPGENWFESYFEATSKALKNGKNSLNNNHKIDSNFYYPIECASTDPSYSSGIIYHKVFGKLLDDGTFPCELSLLDSAANSCLRLIKSLAKKKALGANGVDSEIKDRAAKLIEDIKKQKELFLQIKGRANNPSSDLEFRKWIIEIRRNFSELLKSAIEQKNEIDALMKSPQQKDLRRKLKEVAEIIEAEVSHQNTLFNQLEPQFEKLLESYAEFSEQIKLNKKKCIAAEDFKHAEARNWAKKNKEDILAKSICEQIFQWNHFVHSSLNLPSFDNELKFDVKKHKGIEPALYYAFHGREQEYEQVKANSRIATSDISLSTLIEIGEGPDVDHSERTGGYKNTNEWKRRVWSPDTENRKFCSSLSRLVMYPISVDYELITKEDESKVPSNALVDFNVTYNEKNNKFVTKFSDNSSLKKKDIVSISRPPINADNVRKEKLQQIFAILLSKDRDPSYEVCATLQDGPLPPLPLPKSFTDYIRTFLCPESISLAFAGAFIDLKYDFVKVHDKYQLMLHAVFESNPFISCCICEFDETTVEAFQNPTEFIYNVLLKDSTIPDNKTYSKVDKNILAPSMATFPGLHSIFKSIPQYCFSFDHKRLDENALSSLNKIITDKTITENDAAKVFFKSAEIQVNERNYARVQKSILDAKKDIEKSEAFKKYKERYDTFIALAKLVCNIDKEAMHALLATKAKISLPGDFAWMEKANYFAPVQDANKVGIKEVLRVKSPVANRLKVYKDYFSQIMPFLNDENRDDTEEQKLIDLLSGLEADFNDFENLANTSQNSTNISQLSPVGIKNCGNSCYMNSTLQAMLGSPLVVNLIDSYEVTDSRGDDLRFMVQLKEFVAAYKSRDQANINHCAEKLRKVLYETRLVKNEPGAKLTSTFDADLILQAFADALAALKYPITNIWTIDGSIDGSDIDKDFQYRHVINPYNTFIWPKDEICKNGETLQNSFDLNCKPEKPVDSTEWEGVNVNGKTIKPKKIFKSNRLKGSAPPLLAFSVYSQTGEVVSLNAPRVQYKVGEKDAFLNAEKAFDIVPEAGARYRLIGIMEHESDGMGHWKTWALRNGTWYLCSDGIVTMSGSKVPETEAAIMIYELCEAK